MPPKKRGQNTRGRDKIFRNAVQHVHVGVGHGVLGSVNLQLAAGPANCGNEEALETSAFFLELNELMLSHSTTDFKRFRWEVLELCESKALFCLNHRRIAEKLLLCLMQRDKFAEGFEAFAKLTVAFARDMGEKFLAYFECFYQAINGGIFDAKGQLLVDTKRLQLVFAVQVAWCREMRQYWLLPDQKLLVNRIIRLYVRRLHETKEYIRRLSAEVLAFLCRTVRELVPLVVEEACMDVVQDFRSYCSFSTAKRGNRYCAAKCTRALTTATDDYNEEKEDAVDDIDGNCHGASTTKLMSMFTASAMATLLDEYEQNRLATLPVMDGLCFFAAELLRGIRGSFSTNFEHYYVLLLFVFGLSQSTQFNEVHFTDDEANESEMFGFDENAAKRLVHSAKWKETLADVLNMHNTTEEEHDDDDNNDSNYSTDLGNNDSAHDKSKYNDNYNNGNNNNNNNDNSNTNKLVQESEIKRTESLVLRQLLRIIGATAVGGALRTVAEETEGFRRHAVRSCMENSGCDDANDSYGDNDSSNSEYETNVAQTMLSFRLLRTVTALLEFSLPHARLLFSLLHAAGCKLLHDPVVLPALRHAADSLTAHMKQQRSTLLAATMNADLIYDWGCFLRACGGMLEVFTPLCVRDAAPSFISGLTRVQRVFLPLSTEIVLTCLSLRNHFAKVDLLCAFSKETLKLQEAAKLMLFAFVQDILQKNYAFCLRAERCRISEKKTNECVQRSGHVVRSHLTPFAFSLFLPILTSACCDANAEMGSYSVSCSNDCSGRRCVDPHSINIGPEENMTSKFVFGVVTHAVMILRMMCDRTEHLLASPLYVLLTSDFSFATERQTSSPLLDHGALIAGIQSFLFAALTTFANFYNGSDNNKVVDVSRRCQQSKWADVVAAILPLVTTVVEAEKKAARLSGKKKSTDKIENEVSFTSRFRDALLRVMKTLKDTFFLKEKSNGDSGKCVDGDCRTTTLLTQRASSCYSLFAQASTLLVKLETRIKASHASKAQVECVGFLKDAVIVLSTSFYDRHVKELNDDEMGRLFHGMECLLHSLLSLFGMQLGLEAEVAVKSLRKNDAKVPEAAPEQRLLDATRRLNSALDANAQRALVRTLLLEALASPVHSLRVVALRLLRLLCHPSVAEMERAVGCSSIDTGFFDALLNAECFDPLSSAGNLDGVRQALAKVTFDTTAGYVQDPFQRMILARAMIGLLHTKFADAWPIALKILANLVRIEDTSCLPTLQKQSQVEETEEKQRSSVLKGAVGSIGDGVGCNLLSSPSSLPFSSLLPKVPSTTKKMSPVVWAGVVCRYARAMVLGDILLGSTSRALVDNSDDESDDELNGNAAAAFGHSGVPVWYRIRFSDMQRHEKGELVSKEFSTVRSAVSSITLLQLANLDGEVLSWQHHYLQFASPTQMQASLLARTTDRAVLAKTFLSGLSEITSGAVDDGRALLITELVLELVAVRRGEFLGLMRKPKLLDERLVLAMNACSAMPLASSTASVEGRFSVDVKARLALCNEHLQTVCIGLLSDSNPIVQRAAIDQLKRLKVVPFASCHAQLTPYCDTQQNLFRFLSTFNIKTDISLADKADYISTVLTIALPRLTSKVSKEKLKGQAVLQRRVLSFVTHLSESGNFAIVLERLVQRLIFERVILTDKMEPAAMRFTEMWAEWVQHDGHCTRRLERFVKRLLGSMQLFSALLSAAGLGFASFAGLCLHIALNAYLIGCRRVLSDIVSAHITPESENYRRITGAMKSGTLNTLFAKLRRLAIGVVATLCERFPEEVMDALRKDVAEVSGYDVAQSLMGRYLSALVENSSGAVSMLVDDCRAVDLHQTGAVAPLLRLVCAWVASPITMPLIGAFGYIVTATFRQVFAPNATTDTNSTTADGASASFSFLTTATTSCVSEGLRCLALILASAKNPIDIIGGADHLKTSTLQELYVKPHVKTIFAFLYQLIVRGASSSSSSFWGNSRVGGGGGSSHRKQRPSSVIAFSVSMWKEVIATVTLLSEYVVDDLSKTTAVGSYNDSNGDEVDTMLSRLLEMCIAFVVHPSCAKDRQTCITAAKLLENLLLRMRCIKHASHYEPFVHLLNVVTDPEARLSLCRSLSLMFERFLFLIDTNTAGVNLQICSAAQVAQLAAVGRAVSCMNSFADDNTNFERYDFELRFHTFRSLQKFFVNDGNYGALSAKSRRTEEMHLEKVRQERDYSGAADVMIPLDKIGAPVLCVEAFLVLASNVMYFMRDAERTIRSLAAQLLHAMVLYASRQKERAALYHTIILERVIRREVLPSLRRGIASRDVHIRNVHMQSCGALAQSYSAAFPSFAALHSRNTERCFFANVGHVQHRCRLKALDIVRQNVGRLLPRDILRVFVPFLFVAVKDFSQGKRDLQNLTEGRAKGYCDSVLATLAVLAAALPWEGYYHVLSMLILNARENPLMRLPMLRGVVMLLDHFRFLYNEDVSEESVGECEKSNKEKKNYITNVSGTAKKRMFDKTCTHAGKHGDNDDDSSRGSSGGERDKEDEDANKAAVVLRAKRLKYRNARVIHVMEDDVLPQLYEFLGNKARKDYFVDSELRGNVHTVATVRSEMRGVDNAKQNTAILQLPVAIAITKIVKHFPSERFSLHVERLLDEIILKLRTKNEKHRESARRILSAMLWETGPGKLMFVIKKLRDHFVHGYQLHVLGYTVVTLLYNLYEPQHAISFRQKKKNKNAGDKTATAAIQKGAAGRQQGTSDSDDDSSDGKEMDEEEELVRQLSPVSACFDHAYGVACLTSCLDDLMTVLLDDYLGEVGEQKEQVELMSTMVEVKRNRALHGFALIASHSDANRIIEMFIEKITWLLTPPSEAENLNITSLSGSSRAAALMLQEFKTKYSTISKNATADFVFVKKVRLLAFRVARALMKNATLEIDGSFRTVCELLQRHNEVREAKIRAFEVKDGTRRVRGNVHMTIQRAPTVTRKEQMDSNFLVAPAPERVDVDFNARTVLATQQKQKLRAYRGRYKKELQQAAKDFYREDPTTAIVLDTLDEFLLKYLLSVLKRVLGVEKGRKHTTAVVRLDLLRSQKKSSREVRGGGRGDNAEIDNYDDDDDDDEEKIGSVKNSAHEEPESEKKEEEDGSDDDQNSLLEPQLLGDEEGDELDCLAADTQQIDNDNSKDLQQGTSTEGRVTKALVIEKKATKEGVARRSITDLTSSFVRQHQQLLEKLVPVVLTTLQGEGNDVVVSHALDCLLTLVLLRPPLQAVGAINESLFATVTAFFERGGAIKQRAMRAAAAVVANQRFTLTDEEASRLARLCYAELVGRNEFAPMALSLFHAVLGKHAHVVEVYDLIGVVTELLMHASAKRLMRQRCIAVILRFLTEYRMTPAKFRSHIDLFCRNLDYPEVTGRIAILELIGAMTYRLPTVVLRQEAALLFMSVAVTLTASEFYEARQKAGDVLQSLVRNAGLDVIVPTLLQWLSAEQTRSRKTMALQAWAVMIPAVAASYDMSSEEDAQEFERCCAWSLQAVLDAATHDQLAAASCKTRKHKEIATAVKRKLELKGWSYIFFALRCIEAIAMKSPAQIWGNTVLVLRFVPWLSARLILHTHPWIQAVALRLLRMYCNEWVEQQCGYLPDANWATEVNLKCAKNSETSSMKKKNKIKNDGYQVKKKISEGESFEKKRNSFIDGGHTEVCIDSQSTNIPFVVRFRNFQGPVDSVTRALKALDEISTTLQILLQFIARSDVPNEMYSAHRAIEQPSRANAVSVALYLTRALDVISLVLLFVAVFDADCSDVRVRDTIARHFTSICNHLRSLATPVIKHGSVINVMVRTASLVQYFGGFLAVLPITSASKVVSEQQPSQKGASECSDTEATCTAAAQGSVEAAISWLASSAIGLEFIHDTVVPTVAVAMKSNDRSEKLSALAAQVSAVLREQLDAHRLHFFPGLVTVGTKRLRLEHKKEVVEDDASGKKKKKSTEQKQNGSSHKLTVDDVLFALTAETTAVRETRQEKRIRREVIKTRRKRSCGGDVVA